jgi:hypothetical protein
MFYPDIAVRAPMGVGHLPCRVRLLTLFRREVEVQRRQVLIPPVKFLVVEVRFGGLDLFQEVWT